MKLLTETLSENISKDLPLPISKHLESWAVLGLKVPLAALEDLNSLVVGHDGLSPTVEVVGKGDAIEWEGMHIGAWIDVKGGDCRPMDMSMN